MGIDKETLEAIGQMMDAKLSTVKDEMSQMMDAKLSNVKEEMSQMMDEKLEPVCKRLETLEQGQKTLEQQQAEQAEYERGTRTIIENEVMHDIRLISEQHGEIIKKLDKAAEVDGLKERIMTLERVALKTTDEIDRLKKAQ